MPLRFCIKNPLPRQDKGIKKEISRLQASIRKLYSRNSTLWSLLLRV